MKKSLSISVSSTINEEPFRLRAEKLAAKLNIPFLPMISEVNTDLILAYSDNGLQLVRNTQSGRIQQLLYVDFVKGKNGYRHKRNLTTRQPLARAAGIKPGFRPAIFDATAGLGSDSFVLACLGCKVLMCERSPILHALLEDGLSRAGEQPETAAIIEERIHLLPDDSLVFLRKTDNTFHTIYLDPMYPHRKKTALNIQAMRVIRDLVGDDKDDSDLLNVALSAGGKRVVVKRPKGAENLGGPLPTYNLEMKNSRFDIYLL